jgi:DNA polymerase/3'-5' exonuclease PolX
MSKHKFPREAALKVARALCLKMADCTLRLELAGSLRRGKPLVGDIEIVYIPDFVTEPDGLFDMVKVNRVDRVLADLLAAGEIAKRKNVLGSEIWGSQNKLAVHVASGIPIDFFSTTEDAWFNYLVCLTGGAESNMRIASAAKARGWKWQLNGEGFTDELGQTRRVTSERAVFELVGLRYIEPHQRP